MLTPAWVKRFWSDLTFKEFLPIKALFFLLYGASMAMFPFLTLQARSLGITEKELGIVYAFTPAMTIVAPPLTGMLADKVGNFKILFSVMVAASGAAGLVFSAVPMARRYHTLPDELPLTFSSVGDSPLTLTLRHPLHCDYVPHLHNLTVTIGNCSLCDPTSVVDSVGGTSSVKDVCVPPVADMCEGQQVAAPGETQLRVLNTSHGNTSALEVVHWPDADPTPQSNGTGERCGMVCSSSALRGDLCTNTQSVEEFDPMLTFWSYVMVRVLNGFTLAMSFTLFDGAVIAIMKEHRGDYGLQRLYGNLGAIVVTPLSGYLIDYFSLRSGSQDYRAAFYMYCGMKVFAGMVILFLNLKFRQPSNRVLKDFRQLIKKPEILTFLVVILISGTIFGALDTFLFWLLQDMGAKKYLMGITVTVGGLAGVPILVASGYIMEKLGYANTIILGFAFYVLRLLGYSFITNPWWCMPFEALECFTVSLMSAAVVSYAADMATPSTIATLQGMYGGLYFGVGRGMGSLVGGFLMGPLGVRNTFRLMAFISGVTCVVYFILNRLFFMKLQQERRLLAEQNKKVGKQVTKDDQNKDINVITENGLKKDIKENVSLEETKVDSNSTAPEPGQLNSAFEKDE